MIQSQVVRQNRLLFTLDMAHDVLNCDYSTRLTTSVCHCMDKYKLFFKNGTVSNYTSKFHSQHDVCFDRNCCLYSLGCISLKQWLVQALVEMHDLSDLQKG